jgi:hypothetical protein
MGLMTVEFSFTRAWERRHGGQSKIGAVSCYIVIIIICWGLGWVAGGKKAAAEGGAYGVGWLLHHPWRDGGGGLVTVGNVNALMETSSLCSINLVLLYFAFWFYCVYCIRFSSLF